MVSVAVSGGFDPVHVGHIRLFNEAAGLGDELFVILNNDNWLTATKGYVFMPEQERKEILLALAAVDGVWVTNHGEEPEDLSVSKALARLEPDIFANGGDWAADDLPERDICEELGIEQRFGIGGETMQSSRAMVEAAKAAERTKNLLST